MRFDYYPLTINPDLEVPEQRKDPELQREQRSEQLALSTVVRRPHWQ